MCLGLPASSIYISASMRVWLCSCMSSTCYMFRNECVCGAVFLSCISSLLYRESVIYFELPVVKWIWHLILHP